MGLFMGYLGTNTGMGCHLLPGDHVLSKLFTMTGLPWVAVHDMAHIFIE